MIDIFVSYAREDEGRVKNLVAALERQGWSVFWDRSIPSGESWRSYIGQALDDARCVIVLWSRHSVNSSWVMEEADDAKRRGVLIPVLLDSIEQPRGFREIQAADLTRWQPGHPSPNFNELIKDICRRLLNMPNRPSSNPDPGNISSGLTQERSSLDMSKRSLDKRILECPINLGFDGPTVNELPNGWFNSEGYVSNVSTKYKVHVVCRDDGVPGSCVTISRHNADKGEFGSLMQRVQARYLAGKTIKYEGELRAEGIDGWGGLWLRADGVQTPNLIFDNMNNRAIRGSTPWTRFELSVKLPEETVWLNYGIVLSGSGRLWADNCRICIWREIGQWADI